MAYGIRPDPIKFISKPATIKFLSVALFRFGPECVVNFNSKQMIQQMKGQICDIEQVNEKCLWFVSKVAFVELFAIAQTSEVKYWSLNC